MKKIFVLLLLSLMSFSVNPESFEKPTNEDEAEDYIQVSQKNRDKKIWQNILQGYLCFRQVAKASIKTLQEVSHYAYAASKQVKAVSNAVQTAYVLYDNWNEFTEKLRNFEDFDDLLESVEILEEDVFQTSDYMFYYQLPKIKENNEKLRNQRRRIALVPKEAKEEIMKIIKSDDDTKYTYSSMIKTAIDTSKKEGEKRNEAEVIYVSGRKRGEASLESRGNDNIVIAGMSEREREIIKHRQELKRCMYARHTAASINAQADTRNKIDDTQVEMIRNTIVENRGDEDNKKISTARQTDLEISNNTSCLAQKYSEHDRIKDGVKLLGLLEIENLGRLNQMIFVKAALVQSAVSLSDEIRKVSREER